MFFVNTIISYKKKHGSDSMNMYDLMSGHDQSSRNNLKLEQIIANNPIIIFQMNLIPIFICESLIYVI